MIQKKIFMKKYSRFFLSFSKVPYENSVRRREYFQTGNYE